jgi:excinuclease ABC B subunit
MFKLKAPFKETPAQKEAIEKLVKNLKTKQKHHVLLGVTGSGKSVVGKTPILIKKNGKIVYCQIGKFIDDLFEKYSNRIIYLKESEVLPVNQNEISLEAFSLNPKSKQSEWKPILQLIRHRAPKILYRVKTACGREITVTSGHNFWVLRNGKLLLLPTQKIKNEDFIPLPLEIPEPKKELHSLNLLKIFRKENLMVEAQEFIRRAIKKRGEKEIVKLLSKFYSFPKEKLRKMTNEKGRGRGLPLKILKYLAKKLKLPLRRKDLKSIAVGCFLSKHNLPPELPLSDSLLSLFGYYLAEGTSIKERAYFQIAKPEPFIKSRIKQILKELKLVPTLSKNVVYGSSKTLAALLETLLGRNAISKKLPDFWPNLSNRQLAVLLRAYFTGDGGVFPDEGKISATTVSKRLAFEIAFALLRFGIWARVYRMRMRVINGVKKGNYWEVALHGEENVRRFQKYIGFELEEKQKKLNQLLQRSNRTKRDLIPGIGSFIQKWRNELKISQEFLGSLTRVPRPTISAIETGRCNPQRKTFQKIISGIEKLMPSNIDLSELKSLLNCKWTKIKEIKKINSKGKYVYDLAVKDNETFLAGFGGLFVHNTFMAAKVIEKLQKPTLWISPNKTLTAQAYQEFKEFFPENSVCFWVSYYDYYQPEAYIPETDTYIEKDAKINEEIDRLRHAAVQDVLTRSDVIVCASVSCIYNIGSPEDYQKVALEIKPGKRIKRKDFLAHLTSLGYQRNDYEFSPSTFRVRGNAIDIFLVTGKEILRVEFFGDEIERISVAKDPLNPQFEIRDLKFAIYPAHFWVTPQERLKIALENIRLELQERVKELRKQNKLLEAQRLEQRTNYDLEMIEETGYCHGIENYSRHLEFRKPGEPPWTLLDYFQEDPLVFIDESHLTIPQLRAMANQDRSRKETLIEYGFRLPSCIDNRPLTFEEFNKKVKKIIYVSATPDEYERKKAGKKFIVEQLIRPTGLLEPSIEVRPTKNQVKDLIQEIKKRIAKKQRTLVLTLTKRLAEALADYLKEEGISCQWLHSEVKTLERPQILKELREGKYDVLVGINLLREGLDLPEVALIGILDADKEGFLRSATTLIQIMGRAARHPEGHCILYADKITKSMREAIKEIERRRKIQMEYNKKYGIVPKPIVKPIREWPFAKKEKEILAEFWMIKDEKLLEEEMREAAKNLDFERAAQIRDLLRKIRELKI